MKGNRCSGVACGDGIVNREMLTSKERRSLMSNSDVCDKFNFTITIDMFGFLQHFFASFGNVL